MLKTGGAFAVWTPIETGLTRILLDHLRDPLQAILPPSRTPPWPCPRKNHRPPPALAFLPRRPPSGAMAPSPTLRARRTIWSRQPILQLSHCFERDVRLQVQRPQGPVL